MMIMRVRSALALKMKPGDTEQHLTITLDASGTTSEIKSLRRDLIDMEEKDIEIAVRKRHSESEPINNEMKHVLHELSGCRKSIEIVTEILKTYTVPSGTEMHKDNFLE